MTENTNGERETAARVPVIQSYALAPISALTRWQRLSDESGRGFCRITVLGDPPGPASNPPKTSFYVLDGGYPDAGHPLDKNEARRCANGLQVGDRVELVGNVGPERASARRQEVLVIRPVKKKRDAASCLDPSEWITRPRPIRQGEPGNLPARRRAVSGGPRVVLFSGSREWTDRARVRRDLEGLPPGSLVIEGGNPNGLDAIVRKEAPALGFHVATVNALWERIGRSAGHRRNEAMSMLQPDEAYCYPLGESPGTRGMIEICERECIQVHAA